MRHMGVLLGLLLVMGQSGTALANDCPPGTVLKKIGEVATANGTTSPTYGVDAVWGSGAKVRATVVGCGGTACASTLYDSDATGASPLGVNAGETDDADVKAEPGCDANRTCWQEYDPPLQFDTGITFHDDGNVSAFLAYYCG